MCPFCIWRAPLFRPTCVCVCVCVNEDSIRLISIVNTFPTISFSEANIHIAAKMRCVREARKLPKPKWHKYFNSIECLSELSNEAIRIPFNTHSNTDQNRTHICRLCMGFRQFDVNAAVAHKSNNTSKIMRQFVRYILAITQNALPYQLRFASLFSRIRKDGTDERISKDLYTLL